MVPDIRRALDAISGVEKSRGVADWVGYARGDRPSTGRGKKGGRSVQSTHVVQPWFRRASPRRSSKQNRSVISSRRCRPSREPLRTRHGVLSPPVRSAHGRGGSSCATVLDALSSALQSGRRSPLWQCWSPRLKCRSPPCRAYAASIRLRSIARSRAIARRRCPARAASVPGAAEQRAEAAGRLRRRSRLARATSIPPKSQGAASRSRRRHRRLGLIRLATRGAIRARRGLAGCLNRRG